jgi:hypothetical protein
VWTVPAVTVAVAAPAYAAGVSDARPTVDNVTATYEGETPETLNVNAYKTSSGPISSLSLQLPPKLFDSVQSSEPATVTGNRDDGWTVLLASPGTSAYTALTFGSTTASPWRGFRGEDFVLTAVATSGAQTSDAFPASVSAAPLARLAPATASVTGDAATSLTVSMQDVGLLADNTSAIGRLRIAVVLPASATGQPPSVSNISQGWKVDDVAETYPQRGDGGWIVRFVTTQEAHTARTSSDADRGPASFRFSADLGTVGTEVTSGNVAFYLTSDERAFGWPDDTWKVTERIERFTPVP